MMKKLILAVVIVATLVVAFGTTAFVSAQAPTPQGPQAPGSGYGYGRGMMGGRAANGGVAGQGILHDTMIAVFAEKLGVSVDDLNDRLSAGETMAQIAAEKGFTAEQFTTLMTEARSQAIDQAVKDGTLTQAQADWMKQRGGGMMGGFAGRGAGRSMRGNTAGCPYFTQSAQ